MSKSFFAFFQYPANRPSVASYRRKTVFKPLQLRICVPEDQARVLADLGGRVLSTPQVASLLLTAALEAVRDNHGKVPFPPRFTVDFSSSGHSVLNEKR